ncbi:Uncharacterised protein [Anaerobiospirillum thomasii]|uniref:hypothetical protein n=1 Tax=Anaerobiospirillum thomasii TaxID=179995 RepID=UPI000D821B9B|nr:hypothetical protein [Anaerobiospirillum thomasii]SPT72435.1 Uncharacterised protein [Anaerobiospirillum thomasii]
MSEKRAETNKLIDRGVEFWKFYSQSMYPYQANTTKTYLWLSVTIITALVAVYVEFIKDPQIAERYLYMQGLIYSLYLISCFSSVITLTLGVLCLSSLWIGKAHVGPYGVGKTSWMLDYLDEGVDSESYLTNLRKFAEWVDYSIMSFSYVIQRRASYLRAQSICTLISIFTGIACVFFLVLTKAS